LTLKRYYKRTNYIKSLYNQNKKNKNKPKTIFRFFSSYTIIEKQMTNRPSLFEFSYKLKDKLKENAGIILRPTLEKVVKKRKKKIILKVKNSCYSFLYQ
jgi:hypothetical protein